MRSPFVLAVVVIGGAWVSACSKPVSRSAPQSGPTQTRDIRLASPSVVGSEAPLVSPLEAGQPPMELHPHGAAPAVKAVASTTRKAPVPDPITRVSTPVPAVVSAAGPSLSLAEAPQSMPMAAMPMGPAVEEGRSSGGNDPYRGEGTVSRDPPPTILIRGGMGGVDDKCDLRGRHRPGIAINRMAPPMLRGGIH
jgi:hypothetical protein